MQSAEHHHHYDCVIVGGGVAGLQAAIQLGRYRHDVLVIDANRGRSTLCRGYRNLLGWPAGVSGLHLRTLGRSQAAAYGVAFQTDLVRRVDRLPGGTFDIETEMDRHYEASTMLFATGVIDHIPPIPGLPAALGLSVFICPDCDGYECSRKKTVVLGSGDAGAEMALTLRHWTEDITYINHLNQPVDVTLLAKLSDCGIPCLDAEILHVMLNLADRIDAVVLADGRTIETACAFLAFGGNQVESGLLAQMGACLADRHVAIHPRTRMTSIPNVWAAGDVALHSEQVSIAMGDGAQAAIFIHKALLGEPVTAYQSE